MVSSSVYMWTGDYLPRSCSISLLAWFLFCVFLFAQCCSVCFIVFGDGSASVDGNDGDDAGVVALHNNIIFWIEVVAITTIINSISNISKSCSSSSSTGVGIDICIGIDNGNSNRLQQTNHKDQTIICSSI